MWNRLRALTPHVLTTTIPAKRAEMPKDYEQLLPFEPDAKKAVAMTLEKMEPSDTLLITGSLYLVGELRGLWKSKVLFSENLEATD